MPDTYDISYTGSVQSVALDAGLWKIYCWGANGGNNNGSTRLGGVGGFSSGILNLVTPINVYVRVGGEGQRGSGAKPGGFNGGGALTGSFPAGGGAGATDIRVIADDLNNRIIVAGGGAGAGTSDGGNGGGNNGGSVPGTSNGGTQNAGGIGRVTLANGSWGVGGNAIAMNSGCGGGGWFGGGAGAPSPNMSGGGGGGSGYVLTAISYKPTSYFPQFANYIMTDDINVQPGESGYIPKMGPADGNGYVFLAKIGEPIEEGEQNRLTLSYTSDIMGTDVMETIDFGDIQKITRKFTVSKIKKPIIRNSMRNAFVVDKGITQVIDVDFKRVGPNIPDNTSNDSRDWSNQYWWLRLHNSLDRWQAESDGWRLRYTPVEEYMELMAPIDVNVYLKGMTNNYRETDYISETISFYVGKIKHETLQPPSGIIRYHNVITTDIFSVVQPVGTMHTIRSVPLDWMGADANFGFVGWSLYPSAPSVDYISGNEEYISNSILTGGVLNLYAVWREPVSTWQQYTAGAYNVPIPVGTTRVSIYAHGGGGGGGSGSSDLFNWRGGGGGGGGQKMSLNGESAIGLTSLSVTIGVGGSPNNNGTDSLVTSTPDRIYVSASGGNGGSPNGDAGSGGLGGGGGSPSVAWDGGSGGGPSGLFPEVHGNDGSGPNGGSGGRGLNATFLGTAGGGGGGDGTPHTPAGYISSGGNGGNGGFTLFDSPSPGGSGSFGGGGGGGGGSGSSGASGGSGGSGYVIVQFFSGV